MSESFTLELPERVARSAREVALRAEKPVEEVLVEWLGRMASDLPVESLSDDEVLALCEMQMAQEEQEALSRLLAANREGELDEAGRTRLDHLMQVYRRGLVRKAQAWKEAVARGLKSPLH